MIDSLETYRFYWKHYGGLKGLASSLYLYGALFVTLIFYPFWRLEGCASAEVAISILPSLMSFSLGGMAIVIAISSGPFLDAIREDGAPGSLFVKIMVVFFHYILMQVLALIFAIGVKAYPQPLWLSGVAFFFFTYSILLSLAAAVALLNAARIYNVVK